MSTRTRLRIIAAGAALAALTACSSSTPDTSPDSASGDAASATTSTAPATTAAGAADQPDGCVPACHIGITTPGVLPEGDYQTQWFFGGTLAITLPDAWTSREDSSGEFALSPVAQENDLLLFWLDVYPIAGEEPVPGVPNTAAGLLDWLQHQTRVSTSHVTTGAIGPFPATVVDVRVNSQTENEEPGQCPSSPCVLFLDFPQWGGDWGIANGQVQRFRLADVTYDGTQHLFVAVTYPDRGEDLDAFAPLADEVLTSVQVPVEPA